MNIQIGYEHYENGEREIRLTPIDQHINISSEAAALVGVFVLAVDSKDIQPGDGEIDVAITPQIRDAVVHAVPKLGAFIPKEGNIFFRLQKAS